MNKTTKRQASPSMPIAPIGIIAPPGGQGLARMVDRHLVMRRRRLKRISASPMHPGFARPTYMISCSCPRFADGDAKAVIHESVRPYDLFLITDIGNHGCAYRLHGHECRMGPDEHFQDLKRVIAAIQGNARRINIIMPKLYQGRQHKRQGRESLDCAVALQELQRMGVTNVITFDAHNSHVQNAIPLCGFENLHASYQIIRTMLENEKDLDVNRQRMMVVSPDEGAVDRCLYYANSLHLDLGMFYKRRDTTRMVNGKNPIISHEFLGGDIKGKDILIVDDQLASGQSMLNAARELKARRARRIFVAVTYAILDDQGIANFQAAFKRGIITRVYSTNLSYLHPSLTRHAWFVTVDISDFIAYFIDCLNRNESISALLDTSSKIAKYLRRS